MLDGIRRRKNNTEDKITLEGELTSPFQRSPPLAASPSRAGHEPTPCDQGSIPPWIPRRSAPRGKPQGTDRRGWRRRGSEGPDKPKPDPFIQTGDSFFFRHFNGFIVFFLSDTSVQRRVRRYSPARTILVHDVDVSIF